jgi:hypothetical protein
MVGEHRQVWEHFCLGDYEAKAIQENCVAVSLHRRLHVTVLYYEGCRYVNPFS